MRHQVERTTINIHTKARQILAMTTVFNTEATSSAHTTRKVQPWDSDSGLIGIDNRCLVYMSHDPTDFMGDLQECKRIVKGFGGQT